MQVTEKNPDLEDRLRREIEAVHVFIAAWFNGSCPKDRATFDAGLGSRLAAELVNVQPSGRVLTRDELLEPIFKTHGANADFAITIRNVRLVHVSADGATAVVTYLEDQRGAKNTQPADNVRITTVVFDVSEDAPRWLHLHETAVP